MSEVLQKLCKCFETDSILRPLVCYLKREHFYLQTFSFEITHKALGQNLSQNIKTVFDLSLRS